MRARLKIDFFLDYMPTAKKNSINKRLMFVTSFERIIMYLFLASLLFIRMIFPPFVSAFSIESMAIRIANGCTCDQTMYHVNIYRHP